jgi:hypothetical protein
LNPDIVKLDRIMLSHAAHRPDMSAILPGLVSLLHEAGKLVLIEGVETEHEAQIALACDADFVQGFFFGRPNPGPADGAQAATCIGELTERYRIQQEAHERGTQVRLAPYIRAFERAAERLAAGEALEDVCWNFLALDHAARCFLLDAHGRQTGRNVVLRADRAARETRFLPLADAEGANWLRRPYFRAAINAPEHVHVTRPYLSINEAIPIAGTPEKTSAIDQSKPSSTALLRRIDLVTTHSQHSRLQPHFRSPLINSQSACGPSRDYPYS